MTAYRMIGGRRRNSQSEHLAKIFKSTEPVFEPSTSGTKPIAWIHIEHRLVADHMTYLAPSIISGRLVTPPLSVSGNSSTRPPCSRWIQYHPHPCRGDVSSMDTLTDRQRDRQIDTDNDHQMAIMLLLWSIGRVTGDIMCRVSICHLGAWP